MDSLERKLSIMLRIWLLGLAMLGLAVACTVQEIKSRKVATSVEPCSANDATPVIGGAIPY